MWTVVVLTLIALGILAAGFLIGRYYIPDNRQLKTKADGATVYSRAVSHLAANETDRAVDELLAFVRKENVEELEPYYALGALFRSRGEWNRAIRVHQTLAIRGKGQRVRTLYELGLDYQAAGMPKLASRTLELCLTSDGRHMGALASMAALYEEQGRYADAADMLQRLGKRRPDGLSESQDARRRHLLTAAAQRSADAGDWDTAKRLLREARKGGSETPHERVAAAELAMARGDAKDAIGQLTEALADAPEYARFLVPGLLHAQRGLSSAALAKEFARAVKQAQKQQTAGADAEPAAPGDVEVDERAATRTAEVIERILARVGRNAHLEMALAEMRSFYAPMHALDDYRRVADEFPNFLPARVAGARLALASADDEQIRDELRALAASDGVLAWATEGSWRCGQCGKRDDAFFWRCRTCRTWGLARLDVGRDILDVPPAPKSVAEVPQGTVSMALLGAAAERSLPTPALDSGLSTEELNELARRPTVLGRVSSWVSGALSGLRRSDKNAEPALSSSSATLSAATDHGPTNADSAAAGSSHAAPVTPTLPAQAPVAQLPPANDFDVDVGADTVATESPANATTNTTATTTDSASPESAASPEPGESGASAPSGPQ